MILILGRFRIALHRNGFSFAAWRQLEDVYNAGVPKRGFMR